MGIAFSVLWVVYISPITSVVPSTTLVVGRLSSWFLAEKKERMDRWSYQSGLRRLRASAQ